MASSLPNSTRKLSSWSLTSSYFSRVTASFCGDSLEGNTYLNFSFKSGWALDFFLYSCPCKAFLWPPKNTLQVPTTTIPNTLLRVLFFRAAVVNKCMAYITAVVMRGSTYIYGCVLKCSILYRKERTYHHKCVKLYSRYNIPRFTYSVLLEWDTHPLLLPHQSPLPRMSHPSATLPPPSNPGQQ